jgi:hypothetical protein
MDYKEIINNLKPEAIISLMEKLGAGRYSDRGEYIIFPTICHNINAEEASMKLYYYKNSHLFVCYTEEGSMSIFKFLKEYYETRNIPYNWYDDIYKVILDCSSFKPTEGFEAVKYNSLSEKYRTRKQEQVLEVYPKGLIDTFIKEYPVEWLEDGISKKAMDKYNIRFSIPQNKIIIPHYNVYGDLIGIRGRALDPEEVETIGKYMPVQIEGKWYAHPLSMNLYGLNYNKDNIKKYGICYVGEAEKFCLQMEGFNFPNCSVAVCGSQFNKYQLNLLLKTCRPREIVICFDKEEKPGENKYFNKLHNMCSKYKNYCNMSFIYDRQNISKKKDSPTDNGEKTFIELEERRIIVT